MRMRSPMPVRRARAYAHVVEARVRRLSGAVPRPRVAWLIPTWYCDLKCLTCGVWRRPRDATDLSVAQWRKVLGEVHFLDVVKMLGGEPFTRDDIDELGVAVQEIVQPMIFHTVTAGKEPDRVARFAEAVGAPNLHLRVSIDGLGEIHEKMRGTPGLHARALATIDRLLPLREKKGFTLGVNVAVNDQTLPYLDDLAAFCQAREITIAPGLAVSPFLEDVDPSVEPPRVILAHDKEAIARALDRLSRRPQGGYNLRERLRLGDMNQAIWHKMLDGSHAVLKGDGCEALRSFIYLLPDGGVAACGLRQRSVGNLSTHSFREVWDGDGARRRREEIAACVGCLQHSATVFSRVYGGGAA